MKSNHYILKHDFGYGREPQLTDDELIKLRLRNFEDLKFYVGWTLRDVLNARVSRQNIVKFLNSNVKTKVIIEEIKLRYPWL